LVVEAGRTPREEIERSLERLKEFPILGIVLNKVDTSPTAPYYYYGGQENSAQDGKPRFPWFKK
jgi:Mrp family chromosome partitioning ATPase